MADTNINTSGGNNPPGGPQVLPWQLPDATAQNLTGKAATDYQALIGKETALFGSDSSSPITQSDLQNLTQLVQQFEGDNPTLPSATSDSLTNFANALGTLSPSVVTQMSATALSSVLNLIQQLTPSTESTKPTPASKSENVFFSQVSAMVVLTMLFTAITTTQIASRWAITNSEIASIKSNLEELKEKCDDLIQGAEADATSTRTDAQSLRLDAQNAIMQAATAFLNVGINAAALKASTGSNVTKEDITIIDMGKSMMTELTKATDGAFSASVDFSKASQADIKANAQEMKGYIDAAMAACDQAMSAQGKIQQMDDNMLGSIEDFLKSLLQTTGDVKRTIGG